MANLNDLPETPQNPYANTVGPGGPPPITPSDREPNPDARMWAMFAHLAGLAFLLPVAPIIGSILGPLIIWLIKKDQHPFVDDQGKEALNFQITMLVYTVASLLLWLICLGMFVTIALGVTDIVLSIIAAVKANDGYRYRYPYPLIIRFIK